MSDAVSRHLKTVFHEGDKPTDDDDKKERLVFEFQMPIPSDSHKYV